MYAMATVGTGTPEELILWDVVEEHFDEATFLFDQFEELLDHPMLTLADLERTVESRLLAHLDGLVVGGPPVAERLLIPALTQIGEDGAARITAAALALIFGHHHEPVCAALLNENDTIQRALQLACLLARSTEIDRWALDTFFRSPSTRIRAVLMPLSGAQLDDRTLAHCLDSDDPSLIAAAAQIVGRGAAKNFAPKILQLLRHEDVRVQDAAMMAGLVWGLPQASTTLRQRALGPEPNADLMALYAMLSNPSPYPALIDLLSRTTHLNAALFALGFCGSPEVVPVLIEQIKQNQDIDPLAAKFAMQAIALITGMDLNDDAYSMPKAGLDAEAEDADAQAALPPFEEDGLGSLLGVPEELLPMPNAAGIEQFWKTASARFERNGTYLRGKPFGPDAILEALQQATLNVRHVLASGLAVHNGGGGSLDTRAFQMDQTKQSKRLQ